MEVDWASPEMLAVLLAVIVFFERLGKLIPDGATGPLGVLRKLSKLAGLYLSNRK